MENNIFIDATLFMGMHYKDRALRHRSLTIMSYLFSKKATMNLEQVGICDDLVWGYNRKVQDQYYPFMDLLHSEMSINRTPYNTNDIELTQTDFRLNNEKLNLQQKLLLAQVINSNGILYTNDSIITKEFENTKFLGDHSNLPTNEKSSRPIFNNTLDELYLISLCLKIDHYTNHTLNLEKKEDVVYAS